MFYAITNLSVPFTSIGPATDWADVVRFGGSSHSGGSSGVGITTTISAIPINPAVSTLDHASLSGPVGAGDGTTIFVLGTLTGTDPSAALGATGTGLLAFEGDVLVSGVQVSGGSIVTTGTLTLDAASSLGASTSALTLAGPALGAALVSQGSIAFADGLVGQVQSIDVPSMVNAGALSLGADDRMRISGSTFTNSGDIALAAGATLDIDSFYPVTNSGTITLAAGARFTSNGLNNSGLLAIGTGDTFYNSGFYSGTGTIAMAADSTLELQSVSNAQIALAGGGHTISFNPSVSGLTLDGLGVGDTLSPFGTAMPLTSARYAAGHLYLYSNGALAEDIGTDADLSAATLLIVPAADGGSLTIAATGPLDAGSLPPLAAAERLIIGTSDFTNAGTLHIADVGAVEFQGTVADAGTIAFDGATGSLILDHPAGFHASIAAMQVGDTITLAPGTGYTLAYAGDTLEAMQNGTLAASFTLDSGHDLTDFTLDRSGLAPSIAMVAPAGAGPGDQNFAVSDVSQQVDSASHGDSYSGPVAGLQGQFIHITADNVNVATEAANVFIRTGSGDDAVQVTSGNNVIDASTGSNFLVGGSGHDIFFVDTTGGQTLWDSISNFHAGDALTIWGFTAGASSYSWADGLGAAGYTGLTLQISPDGGGMTAQATLVGLSSADRADLLVQTGVVDGNSYLSITHL